MTQLARLTESRHGDVAVVAVDGEIDASNTGEIGERLRAVLPNRGSALVVDLAATSYLDSAGINLLFTLADDLRQRQQQLHLVIAERSPIARMVALTGLDRAVARHPTLGEALDHLHGA